MCPGFSDGCNVEGTSDMAEAREKSVLLIAGQSPADEVVRSIQAESGIRTRTFTWVDGCRQFLGAEDCDLLVLDLDSDVAYNVDLLAELEEMFPRAPKIALVKHGDIATAIQAIRAGAANCLEKPVDAQQLCSEIEIILDQNSVEPFHPKSDLTPMERTVLRLILTGKTNHEAAHVLHRSPRTIEVHRSHIMRKLEVSSTVDLVRKAAAMGLFEAHNGEAE
jgi:DNA-binding NarL/FixJ family response regulator